VTNLKSDMKRELPAHIHEMTRPEIDQFLCCAPVGRLAMIARGRPYVIPVGFVWWEGRVGIHMCAQPGLKMEALASNPEVCFEVDESLSDVSLAKSVIITGYAKVVDDKKLMAPYLQKLIDKYRVPMPLGEYGAKNDRDLKKELERVRICEITAQEISGRSCVRTNSNF